MISQINAHPGHGHYADEVTSEDLIGKVNLPVFLIVMINHHHIVHLMKQTKILKVVQNPIVF